MKLFLQNYANKIVENTRKQNNKMGQVRHETALSPGKCACSSWLSGGAGGGSQVDCVVSPGRAWGDGALTPSSCCLNRHWQSAWCHCVGPHGQRLPGRPPFTNCHCLTYTSSWRRALMSRSIMSHLPVVAPNLRSTMTPRAVGKEEGGRSWFVHLLLAVGARWAWWRIWMRVWVDGDCWNLVQR